MSRTALRAEPETFSTDVSFCLQNLIKWVALLVGRIGWEAESRRSRIDANHNAQSVLTAAVR